MIRVQFINKSSLPQAQAQAIVSALQVQVTRDFAPAWGVPAALYLAPASVPVPTPGFWSIAFLDNSDVAGALGYHDLTADGLPIGKVFVKTTEAAGDLVSVTASHELLEMLADPDINLVAEFDDGGGSPSKMYAYEVGDPVEDDTLGYDINGVLVSDFVYPAYFEQFRAAGSTRFDHQGKVSQPFQILSGGYLGMLDLSNLTQGWQQVTADAKGAAKARPPVGSRRERRSISRSKWRLSTYTVEHGA
jgi:hypothetical protein